MVMLTVNTQTSELLRCFVDIFTGIGPPGSKLNINHAYVVFDYFIQKNEKVPVPPNFFPQQFVIAVGARYNKGFAMTLEKRTTLITGLTLSTNSLKNLAQFVIDNRRSETNNEIVDRSNHLYNLCVRDIIRIISPKDKPDPESYKKFSVFFKDNVVPNIDNLNLCIDKYESNGNFQEVQQLVPNSYNLAPIKNSFVNARFTIDETESTPVVAELIKQQNDLRNKTRVFFNDPKVTEVVKLLVDKKQAQLKDLILSKEEDPQSPYAKLAATQGVIVNFNQLVETSTNEILNNSSLTRDLEQEISDDKKEAEKTFNVSSKQVDPKISNMEEYQSDLREAKNNLQFQITRRLEYISNENEMLIKSARSVLKSIDLEYIKGVTTRLKSNTTRYANKLKKEEGKKRESESDSQPSNQSNFSQAQEESESNSQQSNQSNFSQAQDTSKKTKTTNKPDDSYNDYWQWYKTSENPEHLNNLVKFLLTIRRTTNPKKGNDQTDKDIMEAFKSSDLELKRKKIKGLL